MAEQPVVDEHGDHDDEETPGYKPPAEKSVDEILKTDAEDESLQKYKAALLGNVGVPFPEDPRQVIVAKLCLLAEGRDTMELDLQGDISALKKQTFVLKEGCKYRVEIQFYVQREIVAGLKYVQQSFRKGIRVDKNKFMVGSYGPKMELQSYKTPEEDAPSGMIARGVYNIKSVFTDDDQKEHLKWEWNLEIKKDWA